MRRTILGVARALSIEIDISIISNIITMRRFNIDEKSLATLVSLMRLEINGIERTALETYLDSSQKRR